jgi:hypothetical protein
MTLGLSISLKLHLLMMLELSFTIVTCFSTGHGLYSALPNICVRTHLALNLGWLLPSLQTQQMEAYSEQNALAYFLKH